MGLAIGITEHRQPPGGSPGQAFYLHLPTRCSKGSQRCRPDNLAIIAIGHNNPAFLGQIICTFERRAIKPLRNTPEKPVAMLKVIGPFAIAQQIASLNLNLNDDNFAFGINAHQISAPVTSALARPL